MSAVQAAFDLGLTPYEVPEGTLETLPPGCPYTKFYEWAAATYNIPYTFWFCNRIHVGTELDRALYDRAVTYSRHLYKETKRAAQTRAGFTNMDRGPRFWHPKEGGVTLTGFSFFVLEPDNERDYVIPNPSAPSLKEAK